VDPRDGLDAVVRRKIHGPYRDSNPRSSSAIPLSCTGSEITVLNYYNVTYTLNNHKKFTTTHFTTG